MICNASACPSTIRPSTIGKRLWDRRSEIATDPFQILYQKNYALCGNVTIDHRERLWDRARKIAPHHLRFFSKKPKAI